MANFVFIACSIDGFIAKPDGGLDWLASIPNETGSDYGFAEFLDRIDAIVMGRVTFETALALPVWPYGKPVFVLSKSMLTVPEAVAGEAEIISGTPREVVARLHDCGMHNLYIDGGKTIQSFLKDDLIDELIITEVSILLGNGIPLFAEIGRELKFGLVRAEMLSRDLVQCQYLRERV